MSDELKPCPFCGETPEIETRNVEPQGDSWYGRKDETFVLCKCGACLFDGAFHEGFGIGPEAEARSIATWNRRAQPAEEVQRDRLLAALERAATAESALRRLADECENDATPGWEDRMRDRIADAERILKDTP